jgi:transcriptional regulator with XRE-family HTH domain
MDGDQSKRKALGAVVILRRAELELSQATLAKRMLITQSQMSKIERGARAVPFEELERLAAALNLKSSELAGRVELHLLIEEHRRAAAGLGRGTNRE